MDPFSLAATGVSILGSIFGGLFGNSAAQAQAKEYEYRAQQEREKAGVNAQEALAAGDATAARAATQAAANGGGLVGSSIGVVQQASSMAMFNAREQVYRGASAAQADLYNAKVAKANGTNALIGGALGAVGAGVSGAADASYRSSIEASMKQLRGDGGYGAYGGEPIADMAGLY